MKSITFCTLVQCSNTGIYVASLDPQIHPPSYKPDHPPNHPLKRQPQSYQLKHQ